MRINRKVKKLLRATLTLSVSAGLLFLLLSASRKQAEAPLKEGILVDINYGNGDYFVSPEEVEQLITRDLGKALNQYTIADIGIRQLEEKLTSNPYIRQAEVFADINGKLHVNIEQERPILRVINSSRVSYYISESGRKMPFSGKFTPRVAVATGAIEDNGKSRGGLEREGLKKLFELAEFIYHDPFLRALVDEIIVRPDGLFELIPKIDNHSILWGDLSESKQKKEKLELFYSKGIRKAGWQNYRQIDLRFKKQIVCKRR